MAFAVLNLVHHCWCTRAAATCSCYDAVDPLTHSCRDSGNSESSAPRLPSRLRSSVCVFQLLLVSLHSSWWCRPACSTATSCSARWWPAPRWRCARSRCGTSGWSLTSTWPTCRAWAGCASPCTPWLRRPRNPEAPKKRIRKRWAPLFITQTHNHTLFTALVYQVNQGGP